MAYALPRRLQKRVLLTRPYSDSVKLAASLSQEGLESVISPVLEIVYPVIDEAELACIRKTQPDIIILTSRHAVWFLKQLDLPPETTLFVVGDSTEGACLAEGFSKVVVADQSAKSLVDLLKKETIKKKKILYLRGENISLNLKEILAEEGRLVQEVVSYEARPVRRLTDEAILSLKEKNLTDVVFYSLRSAQIFMGLIKQEELEYALLSLSAHAISSQVLDFLVESHWRDKSLF